MIARKIRLSAGLVAVCLLGSGVAIAAEEDTKQKNPLPPVPEEEVEELREDAAQDGVETPKESWISGLSTGHEPAQLEEEQPVSEKKVEALREEAEDREGKPAESWISGKSTGHEPAPMEDEEKARDKKDDE